jgi:hypothetical protein
VDHSSLRRRLGTASIQPDSPIVAGSVGQWTITLTVGSLGIDEGGTIKLCQRFASDFEPPQFDQPAKNGFTTVATNGKAKLRPRFDRKGAERPWMQAIVIDVYDGSLAPGDTVTIVLGDRSQGSAGIRAQTFVESAHEFRVMVDPTNACLARPIADSPKVPIISGDCAELVVIVPTQALAEESITPFIRGQDAWGNPTPVPAGVSTTETRITDQTSEWIARWKGREYRSNPLTRYAQPPKYKRFWGDLHAQSDATVGTGTEEEYFTFARDVAKLDVVSHQGNDFQVTDEAWRKLNDTVRVFHRDGSFVAFPGYEWSGNSTAGGDRNVWYLEEDQPIIRSSHWQVPQIPENDLTPADTAADLVEKLRAAVDPTKVLCGAHVGGRYADIKLAFDQELGPLVELVSCWGVFEWMLWDAFDCGYIVGIMCNSDGHKGRPGAEGPGAGQFGIANGLTCVLAEELTRESIFEALKQRRCYGTSGPRIDLGFSINWAEMGSVIEAETLNNAFMWVRGTAPIESIELYEAKRVIHSVRPAAFRSVEGSRRVRVSWRGSRIRGRGRRVQWDGSIRVDGATIEKARTFAFDAPIDGIRSTSDHELSFVSQTTGDTDGIDLWLDRTDSARIIFDSKAGKCEAELGKHSNEAPRATFDFGGLDMRVTIERYPESPTERCLESSGYIEVPAGQTTPYFAKVTQVDGHMAWSSPIYVRR